VRAIDRSASIAVLRTAASRLQPRRRVTSRSSLLACSIVLLAPAAALADTEPYPTTVVLRPPVFPVGVVEASALFDTSASGDQADTVLGLHAGVRSGVEVGLDTLLPLAPEDEGAQVRGVLERVFFQGAHLEITSALVVQYDFAGKAWADTGFEAELTYRLGPIMTRVGGPGLDARLDHTAAAVAVPVGLGVQLGGALYLEGTALAIAGYDAFEGTGTRLAPLSLVAVIAATRGIDLVAGVTTDAGLDRATDAPLGLLTVSVGASYRLAL
jgi:hypothetical protein